MLQRLSRKSYHKIGNEIFLRYLIIIAINPQDQKCCKKMEERYEEECRDQYSLTLVYLQTHLLVVKLGGGVISISEQYSPKMNGTQLLWLPYWRPFDFSISRDVQRRCLLLMCDNKIKNSFYRHIYCQPSFMRLPISRKDCVAPALVRGDFRDKRGVYSGEI